MPSTTGGGPGTIPRVASFSRSWRTAGMGRDGSFRAGDDGDFPSDDSMDGVREARSVTGDFLEQHWANQEQLVRGLVAQDRTDRRHLRTEARMFWRFLLLLGIPLPVGPSPAAVGDFGGSLQLHTTDSRPGLNEAPSVSHSMRTVVRMTRNSTLRSPSALFGDARAGGVVIEQQEEDEGEIARAGRPPLEVARLHPHASSSGCGEEEDEEEEEAMGSAAGSGLPQPRLVGGSPSLCSARALPVFILRLIIVLSLFSLPAVALVLVQESPAYAVAFALLSPAPFLAYFGVLRNNPTPRLAFLFRKCTKAEEHRGMRAMSLTASVRFLTSTLTRDFEAFNPLSLDELRVELNRVVFLVFVAAVVSCWLLNSKLIRIFDDVSVELPTGARPALHLLFSATVCVQVGVVGVFGGELVLLSAVARVVRGRIRIGTLRDVEVASLYEWFTRVQQLCAEHYAWIGPCLAAYALAGGYWLTTIWTVGCPGCNVLESISEFNVIVYVLGIVFALLHISAQFSVFMREILSEIQRLATMRRSVGIDTSLLVYQNSISEGFGLLGYVVTPRLAGGLTIVALVTLGIALRAVLL
ncbi:uncharacterized protein AMSG_06775, partial [Thecamonas trahens ATCC 50062]